MGRDKIARLMKLARVPTADVDELISPKSPDRCTDLVCRNFRAPAPSRLWVADFTYVRILSGIAYSAVVVDVFSLKIVGVATRWAMRTDALPMEALEHALTTAERIEETSCSP